MFLNSSNNELSGASIREHRISNIEASFPIRNDENSNDNIHINVIKTKYVCYLYNIII